MSLPPRPAAGHPPAVVPISRGRRLRMLRQLRDNGVLEDVTSYVFDRMELSARVLSDAGLELDASAVREAAKALADDLALISPDSPSGAA